MQAVMEVGLLKIRQDMAHHFIGLELATAADLAYYTNLEQPMTEYDTHSPPRSRRVVRLHPAHQRAPLIL